MNKLYVYMFRSRNKDNKDIPDFHERCKTLLAYENDEPEILQHFEKFVAQGLPGEQTRLYKSVNARDEEKVRNDIIIRLIRDKTPLSNMNRLIASAAQQIQNRAESKWLFDFDHDDETLVNEFIQDIPVKTELYKTPHGYAVICEHGFDTRDLMKKWSDYDITLKKDELLFLKMLSS